MKNIRWIITLLLLVGYGTAFGQETKEQILKKEFEKIRAEMANDACEIMEYDNSEAIKKLKSNDFYGFYNILSEDENADKNKTKEKYLKAIIGDANYGVKDFTGSDFEKDKEMITKFSKQLKDAFMKDNWNRLTCFKKVFNTQPQEAKKTMVNSKSNEWENSIKQITDDYDAYKLAEEHDEWNTYINNSKNHLFKELAQSNKKEMEEYNWIQSFHSFSDASKCQAFLDKYPQSKYKSEVEQKKTDLEGLKRVLQPVTAKNEFTWDRDGKTYKDSDTLTSQKGDSIFVVILTIEHEKEVNKPVQPIDSNKEDVAGVKTDTTTKHEEAKNTGIVETTEERTIDPTDPEEEKQNAVNGGADGIGSGSGGASGAGGTSDDNKPLPKGFWYYLLAGIIVAVLLLAIILSKRKKSQAQVVSADKELREENAAYERCSTISACDYYLNTYPSGRFVKEVIAKKEGLLDKIKKEEDDAFKACTTVTACDYYLIKYPKGRYVNEVKERKIKLAESNPEPKQKQGKWVVVGASVKGNGHIESGMPCQDNHKYEFLEKGWGIAIVSDGAGSAAHSEIGSKVVVERGIIHFKNLIQKEGWIDKNVLPSDVEWLQKSYNVLKAIRDDVAMVAQKNNVELKSLSATCLVVIFSPIGLLSVHIGDGRIGCKTKSEGWKAIMTPHKGEEANQTIFLVSDFWNIPNYVQSGVLVPESIVVREPVESFALMTDGCENTAWRCTTLDETTGKYYDQNKPFEGFFNPLEETLISFHIEQVAEEEILEKWSKFIESGAKGFIQEQDDKTMIYACYYSDDKVK